MFRGLVFFLKREWKYDKKYILWGIILQVLAVPIPLISAFLPKVIIDELVEPSTRNGIYVYVFLLTGALLVLQILSEFLQKDGFTRRCRVAAEFDNDLHRKLYVCDYGNLENPSFLDLQEKAKKFLYCNWHGFGYLLDCALNILGQVVALLGIVAILASLNMWIVALFIMLAIFGAFVDARILRRTK